MSVLTLLHFYFILQTPNVVYHITMNTKQLKTKAYLLKIRKTWNVSSRNIVYFSPKSYDENINPRIFIHSRTLSFPNCVPLFPSVFSWIPVFSVRTLGGALLYLSLSCASPPFSPCPPCSCSFFVFSSRIQCLYSFLHCSLYTD